MNSVLGAIPDAAILGAQILLVVFLLYWAVFTIGILGLIIMRHKPETRAESIVIGLREAPFAMALAFIVIVGPSISDAIDEVRETREEISL